jgi:hypothetical protein
MSMTRLIAEGTLSSHQARKLVRVRKRNPGAAISVWVNNPASMMVRAIAVVEGAGVEEVVDLDA